MTIFQAIILGAVQGLTEFLPISSSGHLIIFPELFGWNTQSLAFDTILHLGTVTALIIYFKTDLLKIIKNISLLKLLLIGSIPAGVLGFLFESYIEEVFRSTNSVILFLLVGSLLMFLAEKYYKKVWHTERKLNISQVTPKDSLVIGCFQSLALFPGVSRSGATISGGIFKGLTRELSARFSFLLSIPIVLGAGLYKIIKSYQDLSFDGVLLGGFLSSFLVGMLAINFLLRFLKKNTLNVFILYRVVLGILLLLLL